MGRFSILHVAGHELSRSEVSDALYEVGFRLDNGCTVAMISGPSGTAILLSPGPLRAARFLGLALARKERPCNVWNIEMKSGSVDDPPRGERIAADGSHVALRDDWDDDALSTSVPDEAPDGSVRWVSLDEWTAQCNAARWRSGHPLQRVRVEIRTGIALGVYSGPASPETHECIHLGSYAIPRKLGAWPRPPAATPEERPPKTQPILRRRPK